VDQALKLLNSRSAALAKADDAAQSLSETSAKTGKELIAAADASRQTIAEFVKLAGAMKDASRALSSIVAEAGGVTAGAVRQAERQPELGRAIRDLKEKTTGAIDSLPEL
ncbi:MAG: hypothetical protein ABFS30_15470, partial [Pseudomonadota bacterium]